MFVTGTRLRTKIDGTSVDEMRIFTSKGEELDNTTSYVELMLIKTSALINMLNNCKKLTKRMVFFDRSGNIYLHLNERILFF